MNLNAVYLKKKRGKEKESPRTKGGSQLKKKKRKLGERSELYSGQKKETVVLRAPSVREKKKKRIRKAKKKRTNMLHGKGKRPLKKGGSTFVPSGKKGERTTAGKPKERGRKPRKQAGVASKGENKGF